MDRSLSRQDEDFLVFAFSEGGTVKCQEKVSLHFFSRFGSFFIIFHLSTLHMKEKKILFMWILLVIFFGLDALYWYGYVNLIDLIIDNSVLLFFVSLFGFMLLFVITLKEVSFSKARKIVFSFLCTLGIIINAVLVFLWYILKDFGF